MSSGMRCLLALSVLVASVAISNSALAEGSERAGSAADALFESAKTNMSRGDYLTACAQFSESLRLDQTPGTMLNLAECESRLGHIATALDYFEQARSRLPASDFRIGFAEQRIAALTKRVPRLIVALANGVRPDSVQVLRDGVQIQPQMLGIAFRVDPGTHVCVVRAKDRADSTTEVTLGEGETRTLELSLGPPAIEAHVTKSMFPVQPVPGVPAGDVAKGNDSALQARRTGAASDPGSRQRLWGLEMLGAGVSGLALGTVFGLLAKSTYNNGVAHCPNGPSSCDETGVELGATAHTQATISTISFAVGGIFLAGGAALYLTAPAPGAVQSGTGVVVRTVW